MSYNDRISREDYYFLIAETVAMRSTCLRRKYGAIIVANDEIIATGYNGAPRGYKNCSDTSICARDTINAHKGSGYEFCPAVHAEQNAIISASRKEMIGSDIYIYGIENDNSTADSTPCNICARLICNAGIAKVHYKIRNEYGRVISKCVPATDIPVVKFITE